MVSVRGGGCNSPPNDSTVTTNPSTPLLGMHPRELKTSTQKPAARADHSVLHNQQEVDKAHAHPRRDDTYACGAAVCGMKRDEALTLVTTQRALQTLRKEDTHEGPPYRVHVQIHSPAQHVYTESTLHLAKGGKFHNACLVHDEKNDHSTPIIKPNKIYRQNSSSNISF